jgi:predicted Zn-dependent peptidase
MADYDKIFSNADGMHFTFVGNVDLPTAKSLFEKYLGSLPAKPEEHAFKGQWSKTHPGNRISQYQKGERISKLYQRDLVRRNTIQSRRKYRFQGADRRFEYQDS